MTFKRNDFKRKNMSRFKEIDNVVYIYKDFPSIYKDEFNKFLKEKE